MPEEFVTEPEIELGSTPATALEHRVNRTNSPPSIRVTTTPPKRGFPGFGRPTLPLVKPNTLLAILLNRKPYRRRNLLLGDIVVHLHRQLINARLEVAQSQAFLQGHLITQIPHGIGRFRSMEHRLIGRRIYNLVLDLRGRPLGLFICL